MQGMNTATVEAARGTRSARSFADVTYDEALRRAEALIPFLREQAPKCEALRRLTPDVMFRDQRAAAGHFNFSTDAQMPGWALVALGGEFKSPTM